MKDLKIEIKSLPKKPGVYIFRNSLGKIIYIGKALSIKNRVSSYFQQRTKDIKTQELIKNIASLEYLLVNSEFEALLLEARLIKQHKPKYNIALKDNKSYLYIVIGKEFPQRIFLARWPELNEKLLAWYGPFPSSADAQKILRFIRRIFPFRSCKKLPKKTCLYKDLSLCPGVCVETLNYDQTIKKIRQILSGKINVLLKSLIKEMKAAAKKFQYEEAGKIKNQIDALTLLTTGWHSIPKEKQDFSKAILNLRKLLVKYQGSDPVTINKIEGYDVSSLGHDVIVGSMVTFLNGEPEKSLYRKFNLKYNLTQQDDPEGIKQIIKRRLNHPEWLYPQLILIDGGKTQLSAAFLAIKEKKLVNQISLLGLTKELETIIIPRFDQEKITAFKQVRLAKQSLELQLLQQVRDEAHRFAQKYYKERHLKKFI